MSPCSTTSPKHSHVFNIQLLASLSINRTPTLNQPTALKPNYGRSGLIPASRQTGQKTRPRGHRHFALLCTLHQQHHATSTRIPCHATGKSNKKHQKTSPSTSRLRSHTSRRHHHVSSKRHGTRWPQRCILLIGDQLTKQGRRTFFHVQRRHDS